MHLVFAKHFADAIFLELKSLSEEFPNFTFGYSFYRSGPWRGILHLKRLVSSYRRNLIWRDRGKTSDYYSRRLKKFFPWWMKPLILFPFLNINLLIKSELCGRFLDYLERRAPPDPKIIAHIKSFSPDFVSISVPPDLIGTTPDYDYLSASKALGIPNSLFILGWDNLEVKGGVPLVPDLMFLWNKIQQSTAVAKHNIPIENTKIIGAPFFDNFLQEGLRPAMTREEFCAYYGLSPDRPIVLYMGSSSIYRDETGILRLFKKTLENSGDPELRGVQFLVRPHPAHIYFLKLFRGERDFAFEPKSDTSGFEASRRLYYDSIYYSSAVAGICTSGFIHAFIMGKPVISFLSLRYDQIQAQAPHWRQLKDGEVLEIVRTGDEFADTLGNILRGVDPGAEKRRDFIKKYVRPRGMEKPAGEIFADEVEKLFLTKQT